VQSAAPVEPRDIGSVLLHGDGCNRWCACARVSVQGGVCVCVCGWVCVCVCVRLFVCVVCWEGACKCVCMRARVWVCALTLARPLTQT
jgi:hypothetical protein